ncbi:hypothetical protein V8E55_009409 [Tylopilus felleus]
MSTLEPLGVEIRCSLLLSFASALLGFSIGLSGLLRARQELSYINQQVVPHGIIDLGIHDVIVSGAIITAICGLLAVLSVVFFVFTWRPIKHRASFFHIQSWTLFFCAEWLFATLLTFDYFFSSRSAQIIINLNGRPVSPSVIQHLAHILNFTHAYQATYFLRLLAVMPWFACILAVVAGVMLQLAASRADASVLITEQAEERGRLRPWIQPRDHPQNA